MSEVVFLTLVPKRGINRLEDKACFLKIYLAKLLRYAAGVTDVSLLNVR